MSPLEAVIFSSLWAFGLGQAKLEQPEISISRAREKTAHISCKISPEVVNRPIHWYRQKPDQAIEHLTFVTTKSDPSGGKEKFEAIKNAHTYSATLKINSLEQEDEAVYYCACWDYKDDYNSGLIKIFAQGTKVVVTPPGMSLDTDTSPKPTIFLPSMAEIKFHEAGTYLCLLENFFPDVIKIDWKEKNGKRILTSQQGNTMKTNNTYMKYSWMTRTKRSIAKEHKCIFTHKSNKEGADQEILFRSVKKELATIDSMKASLKDKNDPLQLQLVNLSAYYTYVVLLLKSVVYSIIFTYCLLGRPALCSNGKFLIPGGTCI